MYQFQTCLLALTDFLFLHGARALTFQGQVPQGCLNFDPRTFLSTVEISRTDRCKAPFHCAWICREDFRCKYFNVRYEADFGGTFCEVYSRKPSGTLAQQGRCSGYEVKASQKMGGPCQSTLCSGRGDCFKTSCEDVECLCQEPYEGRRCERDKRVLQASSSKGYVVLSVYIDGSEVNPNSKGSYYLPSTSQVVGILATSKNNANGKTFEFIASTTDSSYLYTNDTWICSYDFHIDWVQLDPSLSSWAGVKFNTRFDPRFFNPQAQVIVCEMPCYCHHSM